MLGLSVLGESHEPQLLGEEPGRGHQGGATREGLEERANGNEARKHCLYGVTFSVLKLLVTLPRSM